MSDDLLDISWYIFHAVLLQIRSNMGWICIASEGFGHVASVAKGFPANEVMTVDQSRSLFQVYQCMSDL